MTKEVHVTGNGFVVRRRTKSQIFLQGRTLQGRGLTADGIKVSLGWIGP